MELITAHGGHKVDTNNVTQFQARHDLHRHFVEMEGPYTRTTWRDWLKVVGAYLAGAAVLTAVGFAVGYAWGRFAEVVL